MDSESTATSSANNANEPPKPLTSKQRRILGVLIEKARTTPDAYPLSLSGLVAGANQKSNRHPLMNLTPEQIEDELIEMRRLGIVAEVQGGGRVARYRHYGYEYLGVKGMEAAVMAELLLRGEQTAGDLRVRASRFEPIADLKILGELLKNLMDRGLVVALTPPGRGQMFTHNLYMPEEMNKLRLKFAGVSGGDVDDDANEHTAENASSSGGSALASLQEEVAQLRQMVLDLQQRVAQLES